MNGNRISVRMLDLSGDFSLIRAELDRIAKEAFDLDIAKGDEYHVR